MIPKVTEQVFDSQYQNIFFKKRLEYMTRMSLYLYTFFNIIHLSRKAEGLAL